MRQLSAFRFHSRYRPYFTLALLDSALTHSFSHLQLLECGKCLLIVDTQGDSLHVYLEDPIGLDGALRGKKHKKRILREKLGNDVVTTYDERKRMLVVCGVDDQKVDSYFNLSFQLLTWNNTVVDTTP